MDKPNGNEYLALALRLNSVNKTPFDPVQAFELFKAASDTGKWSATFRHASDRLSVIATSKTREEAETYTANFVRVAVSPDRKEAFARFVNGLLIYFAELYQAKGQEALDFAEDAMRLIKRDVYPES